MSAAASESLIAPYKRGADGQLRPYLLLTLLGVKPGLEVEILGLVDTGADRTVLPIDFAEELGYTVDDLEPRDVLQVEGSASAWVRALRATAHASLSPSSSRSPGWR